MCVDSSTIISINKTPKLKDVFQLLRAKSAYWYDIGRELGVSLNDCVYRITKRSISYHNVQSLETVLYKWLQRRGDSSTWDQLMIALKELGYHDVVREIQAFLKTV